MLRKWVLSITTENQGQIMFFTRKRRPGFGNWILSISLPWWGSVPTISSKRPQKCLKGQGWGEGTLGVTAELHFLSETTWRMAAK